MWKKKLKESLEQGFASEERFLFRDKMAKDFIVAEAGMSVTDTMKRLIDGASLTDHIATLLVVDEKGVYQGALDLKDLIRARKGEDLTPRYRLDLPTVFEEDEIEEKLDMIRRSGEELIPVLDGTRRPVGVMTAEEIADLVEEEMVEDYERLAALDPESEAKSGLFSSLKKRVPWLVVLLFLGLFVSFAVGRFEGLVAQIPAIVAFQSLILGMAGNAGTQSLAVTVRSLSEETEKKARRLILEEARLGFFSGLCLGALAFATVYLSLAVTGDYTPTFLLLCSLSVFFAIWLAMMISSLVGAAIPLTLDRLGLDPAVASGPLITTVNDLVAVVSFYGLATILLAPLT